MAHGMVKWSVVEGAALQIHDRFQAEYFSARWSTDTELAFARFEVGTVSRCAPQLFVDLLLYHPRENHVFVLLGSTFRPDGTLLYPDLVRAWPGGILDALADRVGREIVSAPPGHMEIRNLSRVALPFRPEELTIERVLPGVRDYCTAVNHIKRYRFAREHIIPGRVIDCACGTGYGAAMVLHRQDITGYVGVDLSDFAVDFSSRLVKDRRSTFANVPLAEYPENGFENVVSLETIEHATDPHAFLEDLIGKVAPGGQIILSLPAERWGGSHLNPYHLTNWNFRRFERMISGYFKEYRIFQQRLSLLGPDTFGASEVLERAPMEQEDECFLAILHGPKTARRRRIIVRRRIAIGDVLWTTPVVAALKAGSPESDIVAVTDRTQVFMRNPDADIVATTAFTPRSDDRVVDLDLSYESDRKAHILDAYQVRAGVAVQDPRPKIYPGDSEYRAVGELIEAKGWFAGKVRKIVAVHMAAASPDRVWPKVHWKRLIEELLSTDGVEVLCVGGPDDISPADLGLPAPLEERILSCLNRDQLLVSAAAIATSDLLIAPDSGMAHVAAAVGARGITLYGMANPRTRMPFDGGGIPIWAEIDCRGCLDELPPESAPICRFGKAVCLDRITPGEVLGVARNALESTPDYAWMGRARVRMPGVFRSAEVLPSASARPAGRYNRSVQRERPIRILVLSLDHPDLACARIRLASPLQRLRPDVELLWSVSRKGGDFVADADAIRRADLVIVQRNFPRADTMPAIRQLIASGKKVIYEMDDLLIDLPAGNPNKPLMDAGMPYFLEMAGIADAVTVSTEVLKEEMGHCNRRIFVLPNLIDESIWTAPARRQGTGPVVIGYSGTPTHLRDIEIVEDAIQEIPAKYGVDVVFRFMGCSTERVSKLQGFDYVDFRSGYGEYVETMKNSGFDIALIPLSDNRFNRCKSNIKWLEYGACGIPGIFSDLPPYRSSVSHGRTGLLAGNRTEDWVHMIDRLIRNPDERMAIGNAARKEILENYTLAARGSAYLDVYREILGWPCGGKSRDGKGEGTVPGIAKKRHGETACSGGAEIPVRISDRSGTEVSIVIPLYNKVEYTKKCLDALAAAVNAGKTIEIVLVDNGSTDGTAEFLRTLTGNHVLVRNRENIGFAIACNQGARVARGRNIVFLNNDTVPRPGWLDALLAAAKEEDAAICGARLIYPDGRIQHAGVAFNNQGIGYHIFNGFPKDHPAVAKRRRFQAVTAACMLVRRDVFETLGGFDEEYRNGFEDVDFCLRAGKKGHPVLYVPESVVVHHEETTEGRKTHDRENMERFLSRWSGKVSSDDDRYYAEEGFRKTVSPDGARITIEPVVGQSGDPSTGNFSGPPARGHEPARNDNSIIPGGPASRGRILKQEKRYGEAIEEFRKAVSLGDLAVLTDIGDCFAQEGKLEEADASYRDAIKGNAGDPRALAGLGILDLVQGNPTRAEERFTRALETDGRDATSLCGMGLARKAGGGTTDAFGWFRRALDVDPVNPTALHELVKAAHELGWLEEAERYLSSYLQYKPSDPHILFSLAGILFKSGKRDEALDALDRLAFFEPSYDGAEVLREKIASRPERNQASVS